MKTILIVMLAVYSLISCAYAETYSTWDTLEIDTCASAWLIKKCVDKEAVFKFYPKGEIIDKGIPFDTPDAEFRRTQGMSTFDSIIAKYMIKDPKIIKMGEIIHNFEINYWSAEVPQDAAVLNEKINGILNTEKDLNKALLDTFPVLDDFYNSRK